MLFLSPTQNFLLQPTSLAFLAPTLRASHCTDYHVTSLLFLRVTCPCSLRTYATLKFIHSSSLSSSSPTHRVLHKFTYLLTYLLTNLLAYLLTDLLTHLRNSVWGSITMQRVDRPWWLQQRGWRRLRSWRPPSVRDNVQATAPGAGPCRHYYLRTTHHAAAGAAGHQPTSCIHLLIHDNTTAYGLEEKVSKWFLNGHLVS